MMLVQATYPGNILQTCNHLLIKDILSEWYFGVTWGERELGIKLSFQGDDLLLDDEKTTFSSAKGILSMSENG